MLSLKSPRPPRLSEQARDGGQVSIPCQKILSPSLAGGDKGEGEKHVVNMPIISARPPLSSPSPLKDSGIFDKAEEFNSSLVVLALIIILWCTGCGGTVYVSPESRPPAQEEALAQMGYSVQVGAFARLNNAVRLSEALESYGLDAYYFVHESGLYKVRFGDYPTKESARRKAEHVRAAGIIDEYWIVSPADYAVRKQRKYGGRVDLRSELVGTAKRFIGTPYRWGGTSADEGFDCSGLTMAVYQLNGLKLPRSSRQQYRTGIPIDRNELRQGDLVFFATSWGRRVSHVGIYVGKGRFIHAPGKGKRIRTDLLTKRYYKARYMGARTYLR